MVARYSNSPLKIAGASIKLVLSKIQRSCSEHTNVEAAVAAETDGEQNKLIFTNGCCGATNIVEDYLKTVPESLKLSPSSKTLSSSKPLTSLKASTSSKVSSSSSASSGSDRW